MDLQIENHGEIDRILVESPSPLPTSAGYPISPFALDTDPLGDQAHVAHEHFPRDRTQQFSVEQGDDYQPPVVDDPESLYSLCGSIRRRQSQTDIHLPHNHVESFESCGSLQGTPPAIPPFGLDGSTSNIPDSPAVDSAQDASAAWGECLKRLRKYDQATVKGWKEDIDMLLVLAGLLSAVITAFNVESYKMLQQDSGDVTNHLLLHLSAQMVNNSLPIATQPSWSKPSSAIRINVLWFSSLIFSLAAALIGILVKQWLRDYLSSVASSPRENTRVRQFRYQGLVGWHIPEVIAILPILLQIALASFFVGLLDLLWTLDRIVAGVVTVFATASLLFLIITTILPAIFEDSPHRSPQALAIYILGRWMTKIAGSVALRCFRLLGWTRTQWPLNVNMVMFKTSRRKSIAWAMEVVGMRYPRSWREREKLFVRKHADHLDHHTLTGADSIFMDDSFLEGVIRTCINDTHTPAALSCLCDILINRSHGFSNDGTPLWRPYELFDKGFATLMHLVADILCRISASDTSGILRVLRILERLCKAMPFESEHEDARLLYQRVYSALARLLYNQSEVQKTAFNLMTILFGRSRAPVDAVVTESILSYARHTKSLGDDHSFHVACSMVLDIAHADLNEVAFESLRERLKDMLIDLEKHLSELNTSAVPSRAIPSPSLLVALLDLAARDPELVDETVVQTLNRIITGTVYGPTGSQASLQASHASLRATHYLDLRRAYGSRRPRRQNAVLLVNELDDLGLTLPSGNELQPAASTSPSSTT